MEPKTRDAQIWHCRPLAVTDPDGILAYAGDTDVEFLPEEDTDTVGWATVLTPDARGICPTMHVESRVTMPKTGLWPHAAGRAYVVLDGIAPDGSIQTWYLDAAADEFLLAHA